MFRSLAVFYFLKFFNPFTTARGYRVARLIGTIVSTNYITKSIIVSFGLMLTMFFWLVTVLQGGFLLKVTNSGTNDYLPYQINNVDFNKLETSIWNLLCTSTTSIN